MKLWQQSVVEGRYVMSYQLSSTQWRQVESFLPGRPGWVGVTAKDNRTFVNGVPRFHGGRLCGCCAAAPSGKTCPRGMATGKASTNVSPAGPGPESGRGSSKCCWMTRTTDT